MSGFRRTAIVISGSGLMVLGFARICFANPIIASRSWDAIVLPVGMILLLGFSLTAIIESWAVCAVFWAPWRIWWRILVAVGLVNLITFPTAQAAWCWWNYGIKGPLLGRGIEVPLLLLELLVCVAEFFLLRWQLSRMSRRGFFKKQIQNGRVFWAVLVANLASFVVGYSALDETNFFVSTTWLP